MAAYSPSAWADLPSGSTCRRGDGCGNARSPASTVRGLPRTGCSSCRRISRWRPSPPRMDAVPVCRLCPGAATRRSRRIRFRGSVPRWWPTDWWWRAPTGMRCRSVPIPAKSSAARGCPPLRRRWIRRSRTERCSWCPTTENCWHCGEPRPPRRCHGSRPLMLPVVVIAGRPNVGKSTLFNRLAGRRSALVADTPGVTRDRKEAEALLRGRMVTLVDTAGLEEAAPETLAGRLRAGAATAVEHADLVVFVVDARNGVTPADRHFAQWLRRQNRPLLLVANKAEGRAATSALLETYSLGLGDPVAVSAEHGEGISDLMSEIAERLPPEDAAAVEEAEPEHPLRLAVVGRPNAGKSTLINRLLGEERMITGPEPGLTRDAVAVLLHD